MKLAPGANAKEFAMAAEPGGSGLPRGQPVGGIVGIEPGGRRYFTQDFEPGSYGLICFFTDMKSGALHDARGMTLEFTVE